MNSGQTSQIGRAGALKTGVSAAPKVRRRRQRGAEIMEFTLVLLPFLAMLYLLFDASWAIFAKATLQYAVRTGVRQGITITGAQATTVGETQTQMVKDAVQANALGLLAGTTGRAYIQVHYWAQDAKSATGVTDVSTQSNGNNPGNIMQVEVVNFPLGALVPRIYSWKQAIDKSPSTLNVVSADEIEPSGDIPPIGTAP